MMADECIGAIHGAMRSRGSPTSADTRSGFSPVSNDRRTKSLGTWRLVAFIGALWLTGALTVMWYMHNTLWHTERKLGSGLMGHFQSGLRSHGDEKKVQEGAASKGSQDHRAPSGVAKVVPKPSSHTLWSRDMDEQEKLKLLSDVEAEEGADVLEAAEATSAIHGFSLIPRPVRLHPLGTVPESLMIPASVANESSKLLLWDDDNQVSSSGSLNSEFVAAAQPFEEIFGLHVEAAGPLGAVGGTLHSGSVILILRKSRREARKACHRAAGYAHNIVPPAQALPEAAVPEWHFALLVHGRLAVCAVSAEGLFRFSSSLRQILHPGLQNGGEVPLVSLPSFILEDWPLYHWRGLQLDTVRHFMPKDFLKRYLRAMSFYKANVFHWHLTDDQSWRLFLKSRPKLVNSSSLTSPEFYTQADVAEMIAFAKDRFISIVPVIETPGHALSILASYPELACEGKSFKVPKTREGTYTDILCVTKKESVAFAEDVFAEIATIFPGQYIHVGGDEIPTDKWERSPDVQKFAEERDLDNQKADILEWWFCTLSGILKKNGKTMVVWDDHFENRKYNVKQKCQDAEKDWVVQGWKLASPVGTGDKESVSPSFPFRTITSSMKTCYLDYPVASINYNKTLTYEPVRKAATHPSYLKRSLGGAANMWTEDSLPEDVGSKVYPRYLGLAERLWGAVDKPDSLSRVLDLSAGISARRHCAAGGPLQRDFGFSCGKFELRLKGRSSFWTNCKVHTTMDAFEQAYNADRALDGEEETYFWAIAPKAEDTFDVWFLDKTSDGEPRGRWLASLIAATGGKERPGDQLDKAELSAVQWVPDPLGDSSQGYTLRWIKLGSFTKGEVIANSSLLAAGPVVGIKIKVLEGQVKWAALREITAVENDHPTEKIDDKQLKLSGEDRRKVAGSPWAASHVDSHKSGYGLSASYASRLGSSHKYHGSHTSGHDKLRGFASPGSHYGSHQKGNVHHASSSERSRAAMEGGTHAHRSSRSWFS